MMGWRCGDEPPCVFLPSKLSVGAIRVKRLASESVLVCERLGSVLFEVTDVTDFVCEINHLNLSPAAVSMATLNDKTLLSVFTG